MKAQNCINTRLSLKHLKTIHLFSSHLTCTSRRQKIAGMERVNILTLTLFVASLLFVPKMEAQRLFPPPRPLCASQFALANYACALLPFTPTPLPTPPSPPPSSPPDDDGGQEQEHEHEHGHGHGHGHRHGHNRHRHGGHHEPSPSPAEDNCCRWLTQLDNECVCELLVHLPTFLLKPTHAYTVAVGEFCRVTYTCGTPIRIKV